MIVHQVKSKRVREEQSGRAERHKSPSDPARDTAAVLVLTASFEKMRLTCDFTVSGEISRVRAMPLLESFFFSRAGPAPRRELAISSEKRLTGGAGNRPCLGSSVPRRASPGCCAISAIHRCDRLPPADLRPLHGGFRHRRSDRGETAP